MRDLAAYEFEYERLPFEERQVRYRKRKILEFLEQYQAQSVLEVGCGLDPLFIHYKRFQQFTVVEPVDGFLSHARALSAGRQDVTLVGGILENNVDFLATRTYDFIVLSSLLHEIGDVRLVLAAVRRLCGRQTVVHINVPNALSFHRMLACAMGLLKDVHEPSETQKRMQQSRTFDLHSLYELVCVHGFQVLDKGTFFIKPFSHAQMAALGASGFLTDQMLDGLYAMSAHFPEHGSEIFMNVKLAD